MSFRPLLSRSTYLHRSIVSSSSQTIRRLFNPLSQSQANITIMATGDSSYASAEEEKRWNHLSDRMNSFHEYFKYEFKEIYEAADGSFTKRGLSLAMYLDSVRSFNSHLTMHHTIEERHIFPILAKKIPKFANTAENGHVDSHKAIHDGLEALMRLVTHWRKEPTTYSPKDMIATLDKLKPVLFEHLDQEVQDLKGDQLKLHFTLKEIESLSRL